MPASKGQRRKAERKNASAGRPAQEGQRSKASAARPAYVLRANICQTTIIPVHSVTQTYPSG